MAVATSGRSGCCLYTLEYAPPLTRIPSFLPIPPTPTPAPKIMPTSENVPDAAILVAQLISALLDCADGVAKAVASFHSVQHGGISEMPNVVRSASKISHICYI